MNETETKSAGRRRFFKRAAIATAIGSIAAAVGFKVFAETGDHMRRHRGLMHANFTPEQAEQRVGRGLRVRAKINSHSRSCRNKCVVPHWQHPVLA